MGRRVLVTGATGGIGTACVAALEARGFEVVPSARTEEQLRAFAERGYEPVHLDLHELDDLDLLARTLEPGGLWAVVHAAGFAVPGAVEDLGPAAWREQFDANLVGPMALTGRLVAPLREAGGRVVFVSSQAGRLGLPLYGAYASSKAALEGAADALRMELRPHGVSVSIVQPAAVRTAFQDASDRLFARHVDVGSSRHAAAYERIDRRIVARPGTVPVARVARAVTRALTARRPRARYTVGRLSAAAVTLAHVLPAFARDRAVRWYMGAR